MGSFSWSDLDREVSLDVLVGKKIARITGLHAGSDEVGVETECGHHYAFGHIQDCCESVDLNDFDGDPDDLVGATVLSAEQVDGEAPVVEKKDEWGWEESQTWTFYKIETDKGGIWMRWFGESNGYYSESVDFIWVNKPEDDK